MILYTSIIAHDRLSYHMLKWLHPIFNILTAMPFFEVVFIILKVWSKIVLNNKWAKLFLLSVILGSQADLLQLSVLLLMFLINTRVIVEVTDTSSTLSIIASGKISKSRECLGVFSLNRNFKILVHALFILSEEEVVVCLLSSNSSFLSGDGSPWLSAVHSSLYDSIEQSYLELHATAMLCLPSGECMCPDATLCTALTSALYSSVSEEVVLRRQLMVGVFVDFFFSILCCVHYFCNQQYVGSLIVTLG